jgi:hypothetical protein
MLEARVKELRNQAYTNSTQNESLNARLVHFLRKEVAEKEAAEKGAAEEDDDKEEDQQALPSGSSPIRFSRGMCLLKCPSYLNYLYKHKNGLLFHIESFIYDEISTPPPPPTWLYKISTFLGCSICNHE